ncbi:MAG TPA: serine acetyltransferase [Bacteroides sp.]|nr:serine acetyltransferase [Bacteroides sp.]
MKSGKLQFPEYLYQANQGYADEVPSGRDTHAFVEKIIDLLFPFRTKSVWNMEDLRLRLTELESELESLMQPLRKKLDKNPSEICKEFIAGMPDIYELMMKDAEAFMQFDPAAESIEEIILCYPGFFSIAVYRIAHELWKLNVPVLPRVMTEYAHSKTGVDIHPGARIGASFFIDHGTGTVIGETSVIGDNVKIYQGVTLGALFVKKSMARQKRHPTIEDNVIIYARSTILGGDTTIGHDSVIGGNVWLTESVLPYSVVYQKNHVVVRDSKEIKDQINWVI